MALATFNTPGQYTWYVPAGITQVTFDVYGAKGGSIVIAQRPPARPLLIIIEAGLEARTEQPSPCRRSSGL
jgi:hypothetical protein